MSARGPVMSVDATALTSIPDLEKARMADTQVGGVGFCARRGGEGRGGGGTHQHPLTKPGCPIHR